MNAAGMGRIGSMESPAGSSVRSAQSPQEPAEGSGIGGFAGVLDSAQAAATRDGADEPDDVAAVEEDSEDAGSDPQPAPAGAPAIALAPVEAPQVAAALLVAQPTAGQSPGKQAAVDGADPLAAGSAALPADGSTEPLPLRAPVAKTDPASPANDRLALMLESNARAAAATPGAIAVAPTGAETAVGTAPPLAVDALRPPLQHAPQATAAPANPQLQQPVGSAPWRDELGAQLAMMVDRGEQVATLQLTPDELGPLEVRIALREGEASVWFGAAAGDTRAALEQALPRLRELFAASGLALGQATVQGESSRDPQRAFGNGRLGLLRRDAGSEAEHTAGRTVAVRRGLLDLYA